MFGRSAKTLPIRMIGDSVLEQTAKPVPEITEEISVLAERMIATMYKADGCGLAAPQVGLLLRMFVLGVDYPDEDSAAVLTSGSPGERELLPLMPLALVNPEITFRSPVREFREEGCLSLPKLYARVERPVSIRIKARLIDGRPIDLECGGFLARAIQHEYDHLDGIVFAQRLDDENLALIRSGIDGILRKTRHTAYRLRRIADPS